MRTRQHPMALVHPTWIIAALLSLAIAAAVSDPALVQRSLHMHAGDFTYQVYHFLVVHKTLAIGVPGAVAILFFLGTWSSWAFTYLELNAAALTYRLGPFSANSIPRRAVQDVSFTRGIFGMLLGYGTLQVFAGREVETIPFVPHVETLVTQLQGPPT
jgi:hypothetical protein